MFQLTPEIRPHSAVLGAVSAAEGRRAAAVGGGEEGGGEAPRKHEAFRGGEGKDTAGMCPSIKAEKAGPVQQAEGGSGSGGKKK